jgi:hypothetical protein
MTAEFDTDLERRRVAIRQRRLLLALEQWGPGYAAGVTQATAEERAWLEQYVARNGMPAGVARDPGEWPEVRRAQGRQANAAASAAFLAGDHDRARDLVDEARAYGAVLENEWRRLHEFIAARAAEAAPSAPAAVPPPRPAAAA